MHGTETALSNQFGAKIDQESSIRRQAFALFGLILPLFVWGQDALADGSKQGIQSLEQTLRESGRGLPRFHMRDGRSIVGRFIGINAEAITLRRPAGGLRSVPIAEIENVEILDGDGRPVRGWLTALGDGTIGWTALDPSRIDDTPIAAATSEKPSIETGGPLIKLPSVETDDLPGTKTAKADTDETGDDVVVEKGLARNAAGEEKQLAAIAPSTEQDHGIGSDETVRLDLRAEPASEAENVMYFRLSLSAPSERSVLIIYSIINGSAKADADFKHRQGVLVFAPGEQDKALAIEIVDDDEVEDIETFQLFVTADPDTVTIDTRTVEAHIQDNDS